MAKQLVNPVERHVEKLIVGIAALLLIGSVVRYGITSPNKVDLGGESVTAANIDEKVAAKAAGIRDRIRSTQAQVEQPDPILDDFVAAITANLPESSLWAAPPLPNPPLVDRQETPVGQKALVSAVVPDAPELTAGRSTVELVADSGIVSYPVIEWVTITSLFNVKHQSDVQKLGYGAQYGDIDFGPFELQRRARRPDGIWSDEDWATIEASPAAKPVPPPPIDLIQEGDRVVVSTQGQAAVTDFHRRITLSQFQLDLLRPMMHKVVNGTTWSFAVLTGYEDVLRQDDHYLYPDEPPAQFPVDRYGLRERPKGQAVGKKLTVADKLKEIQDLMKSADANCSPDLAIDAHNKAFDLARSAEASASEKQRAAALQAQADQLSSDILRKRRLGQCKTVEVAGGGGAKIKRVQLPVQQFWLHDAAAGSVMPGRTYQYRVRCYIFNQLAGDATKFADPKDAATLLIGGDWSEPSRPITIAPKVEFWVTSDDAKKEEVGVELFQWSDGVWVKDRFKFRPGDEVRGESRQKVPSFEDPTVPFNAKVQFNASATLVGLDFGRSVRDHKRGKSREGFIVGSPEASCTALFVNDEGQLFERSVLFDKADSGKRAAAERVDLGEQVWKSRR